MLTAARQGLALLEQGNLGELAERILYKCGRGIMFPFFYYDHFFLFELDLQRCAQRPLPSGLTVRQAGPADIPAMNGIYNKGNDFAQRFGEGCSCFLAETGGKIVGMSWIELREIHTEENNEFRISLPPDAVWAFDSFIVSQQRGAGIWHSIVTEVARQMLRRGKTRMYCLSDRFNRQSITAHLRIGYVLKKEILFLRAFFLRVHWEREMISERKAGPWQARARFSQHAFLPRIASWTVIGQ
jgi:hypothetical protein